MSALHQGTNLDASARSGSDGLAADLKAAASQAAELVGGGVALLFASESRDPDKIGLTPLRSAAGFGSPEEAKAAAAHVEKIVAKVVDTGRTQRERPEASLSECAEGDFLALPIQIAGRTHGALVVAAPGDVTKQARDDLRGLVDAVALRADHAMLCGWLEKLSARMGEKERSEEEKSDEILKLSEALFAQDIELLRSSEKLGKVEKLKNDFIEKMSRELRTPLNAIIEAIISVLAGENENLSDLAKENLRCALDDGTAFLRTLQNILDLWRIKQSELPVESQVVNFREVVEEAIFSVQDSLGTKPVRIEKKFREPLPKIRTDLAKVNQILFLLLDNAAKFTRDGSIEISTEVDEGQLRCQIVDTGIGICADDQEYLFDEFYQVDASGNGEYRGAGLGLTLVKDLLCLLEGQIDLDSEVGAGTRVRFEIPIEIVG